MKITDVKTASVQANYLWTFVRVYTDEGITGLGECYWGAGLPQIIEALKRFLVGENPLDVNRLHTKMMRGMALQGSIAGNVVTAISGVEIALWDLAGKALGVPVYRLLGGKYRDHIRLYCDAHIGKNDGPGEWAKRAREIVDAGFISLKFDLDPTFEIDRYNRCLHPKEIRQKAECVQAARKEIGPDVELGMDFHYNYNTSDAIQLANALEEFNLAYVEDPIPPENLDAMAEVTRSIKAPTLTGENLFTLHAFRSLFEKQATRIAAPDAPKVGGLAEAKKIADLADVHYIPLSPHNLSSPIGTLAACHFCASIPNFLSLEYHWIRFPHWEDIALGCPTVEKGHIQVPEAPGLGIELNEEVARKYLVPGTGFFE
jgi:L-alanine-DL-glutamate epimerase-like enolase superfamily enzyme